MIALVFCVSLLAGCGNETKDPVNTESSKTEGTKNQINTTASEDPSFSGTEKAGGTASVSESETQTATEKPTEPAEPFDMEAFLTELSSSHPNASAEELCDEILKNEYFILYRKYGTDFSYPGIKGEYDVKSKKKEAFCVTDASNESVIMVIVPKSGIDCEKMASELKENANYDWDWLGEMYGEDVLPDKLFAKAIDGKVFFSLYHSDMEPIREYAEKARDYVEMFHNYLNNHPNADVNKFAGYLASHQSFNLLFSKSVSEGRLTGFGDFTEITEITGFSSGAVFKPQVDPSDFIGYVFKVKEGTDVNSFKTMLKEKANLGWNVCITLNTIIVESDGDYVLFMMCDEKKD